MKTAMIRIATATALGFAFASSVLAAGAGRPTALSAPGPGDLVASALDPTAPPAFAAPPAGREPVAFSWPLDPASPLAAETAGHRSESREYWVQVTAAELSRGVPLYTTAPGAVVRLSPADVAAARLALAPAAFSVTDAAGAVRRAEAATSALADAASLRQAGAAFPAGTWAFRLRPEVGSGHLTLAVDNLPRGSEGRFVLHLFEPASDVVLAVGAERGAYLAGDTLAVEAALTAAGEPLAGDEAEGTLIAPDGRTWEVTFRPSAAGRWRAELPLAGLEGIGGGPGLWEAHAVVSARRGEATAVRCARAAFALAVPTARLTGAARVAVPGARGGDLSVVLGVDAAVAGRYEVRGVLWGTGAAGQLVPVAAAHSAAWLEPGTGELTLRVDAATLAAAKAAAPFELRDLRLVDQGRMGLLHRQERALAIAP